MSASYKAPLSDLRFALYDVLGVEPLFQRLGYPDATRDILDAVLDEAARFSETVLAPLNSVGEEVGSTLGHRDHRINTALCPGGKERTRRLMNIVEAGRLDLGVMVTHHYKLDDIVEAYDLWGSAE